jgi:hypothetical protein
MVLLSIALDNRYVPWKSPATSLTAIGAVQVLGTCSESLTDPRGFQENGLISKWSLIKPLFHYMIFTHEGIGF